MKVLIQQEFNIRRDDFIRLLAKFIEQESVDNPNPTTPEPYRAAGDRLVDEALNHIE